MFRYILLAVLASLGPATVPAMADTVAAGERLTLQSKVMGEERTVFVSLPPSYTRSNQRYPVLYLTDAQWQFDQIRSTANFLSRNEFIPEMIIVGVANADRTRDLYATKADFKNNGQTISFPTSGNADQFLEFIETELIPWVESRYRTTPLRILAGHSAGGNFAMHTMRMRPELFQAVIAASPWLSWDDSRELKALEPFLAGPDVKARALFFTCGGGEGAEMKANLDVLAHALRERKNDSLRWGSTIYPGETHDSVVIKSYFDGLRMIFDGWSPPRDPQTNLLTGSLDQLRTHFTEFGERLGVAMSAPEGIVNELGYELLHRKELDASIAAFQYNAERDPQSANVWDSLGDGLDGAGKKEEALASYRKAVSLAEANNDSRLDSFKKQVSRMTEVKKPDER
jgi:hypothetical protein